MKSERSSFTREPPAHRLHEPTRRPVPKYKYFNGVRYELASQDIYDKPTAQAKAKSLAANGYYKTRVIRIQGAWRVYAHLGPTTVDPHIEYTKENMNLIRKRRKAEESFSKEYLR